ncbi:MAG: recombination protein RecR, partial [Clostridia bacterium]|nr:recombination protein RecR [Clostridia bacterium]
MSEFIPPLEILIEHFQHLPGIGRKTAQRLAFSIVDSNEEDVMKFAEALVNAKKNIHYCPSCYNYSQGGLCAVCSNGEKDRSVICVVEDAKVLMAIERVKGANKYNGLY